MSERYEPCTACAESRKAGDLAEAALCRSCKGTGIKRTRESWVCNGCGGCLCVGDTDDSYPYGLVDAAVSGAYSSTHLSDCTNYKFSLCEGCLRELFDGCVVKPRISEYAIGVIGGDDMETGETYEEEALARKKADEESASRKAEFFRLYDEKRCADHDRDPASETRNDLKEYCAREGFGQMLYEDSSWPYAKRWLCERHLRNAYAITDATIVITGHEPLTGPARCRIGLDLLAEFRAGRSPEIAPCVLVPGTNTHSGRDSAGIKAIAISTLLPLLMEAESNTHAARELRRITGAAPPHAKEWIGHRIPLAFRPGQDDAARVANDWLTWGREQEYDEAVATACLGDPPEHLWSKT